MMRRILANAVVVLAVVAAAACSSKSEAPASPETTETTPTLDLAETEVVPGSIVVDFKDGTTKEQFDAWEAEWGVDLEFNSVEGTEDGLTVAVGVDDVESALERIRQNPAVESAEPLMELHASFTPNDPDYGKQWNLQMIDMPKAWDESKGKGVVVAVLDTGIAYEDYDDFKQVPDLKGTKFVKGYDFVNDDEHANDDHGHGTHVAGTIGASTDNGSGVAGVTWTTRIMPVRVLGKQGGTSFDIATAMIWATGGAVTGLPTNPTPAKVVNMSLGGASPPTKTYQDAIDARVPAGAIFVIAAGNENTDASNSTPCNQQNVICVGSTNFAGKRSSFSNFGTAVDVMAAGGEMTQDLNGDGYPDGVLSTSLDDKKQPAYVFTEKWYAALYLCTTGGYRH